MKRFHIGYYLATDKKMISAKNYNAKSIIEAMYQYIDDEMDIKLIKYIVEMDEYSLGLPLNEDALIQQS